MDLQDRRNSTESELPHSEFDETEKFDQSSDDESLDPIQSKPDFYYPEIDKKKGDTIVCKV